MWLLRKSSIDICVPEQFNFSQGGSLVKSPSTVFLYDKIMIKIGWFIGTSYYRTLRHTVKKEEYLLEAGLENQQQAAVKLFGPGIFFLVCRLLL